MLADQPELTLDLRTAAAVILGLLERAIMLTELSVSVAETPHKPRNGEPGASK